MKERESECERESGFKKGKRKKKKVTKEKRDKEKVQGIGGVKVKRKKIFFFQGTRNLTGKSKSYVCADFLECKKWVSQSPRT